MYKIALIDNDFVQKLAEIKCDCGKEKLVRTVFNSMEVSPKMHELVHKHEFMDINNAGLFFDHGIITVLGMNEIFNHNPEKEAYYCILISELYKKQTGKILEELGITDIIKDWKAQVSLGEYHSLAACLVGGYGLFLSDDWESKDIARIINKDFKKRIEVYNREEFVRQLDRGLIKKHERRAFTHKGKKSN